MNNHLSHVLKTPRRRIETFIQRYIRTETSSGVMLIACTLLALLWANSPLSPFYHALWDAHFMIGFADLLVLDESLLHWINDGLMAIFFLVVGLEIKREVLMGELSSIRRAMLPAAAAVGGMVAPALIYLAILAGGEGSHGWGIPMATDIAFSLGVLMLLGSRAPLPLKIFLTGLAIVDDLGAVLVIAFFYNSDLHWIPLAIGGAILLILIGMNIAGVRRPTPYLLIGALLWLAFFESGIHATIAGVLVALTIPARVPINAREFVEETQAALNAFEEEVFHEDETEVGDRRQMMAQVIDDVTDKVESPLHELEHSLHPFVSYVILPLFALANAGVSLQNSSFAEAFSSRVALGIIGGLLIGKPVGIFVVSFIAVRLRLAEKPAGMRWRHVFGVSLLAGIGFTMSIFITTLAFTDPNRLAIAKIAIMSASLIAGAAGFLVLRGIHLAAEASLQPE